MRLLHPHHKKPVWVSSDQEGRSFTELEFDYAKKKGKHVLVFLNEEKQKEECDNSEALKKFISKVKNGRLVKTWTNKTFLELAVFKSLSTACDAHPQTGWVRGDIAIDPATIVELENARAKIKQLEKSNPAAENATLKIRLDEDEIACFQNIVAETTGLYGAVTTHNFENSMTQLGYDALSVKLALNKLKSSGFISVDMVEHELENELYEILQILDLGWSWIEHNKQKFASRIKAPNFTNDDIPF